MFDFGWGGGLGWAPSTADGSLGPSSLEDAISPRCTVTPDCKGMMIPKNETTLRCSVCEGEIPIVPDERGERAKDADEEQR